MGLLQKICDRIEHIITGTTIVRMSDSETDKTVQVIRIPKSKPRK